MVLGDYYHALVNAAAGDARLIKEKGVKNGKIDNYQAVVPSTWNAPRVGIAAMRVKFTRGRLEA